MVHNYCQQHLYQTSGLTLSRKNIQTTFHHQDYESSCCSFELLIEITTYYCVNCDKCIVKKTVWQCNDYRTDHSSLLMDLCNAKANWNVNTIWHCQTTTFDICRRYYNAKTTNWSKCFNMHWIKVSDFRPLADYWLTILADENYTLVNKVLLKPNRDRKSQVAVEYQVL